MPHPPGQGGLIERLAAIERRLDEQSRRTTTGAVCVVRLATSPTIAGSVDTPLVTSWHALPETDTAGTWHYNEAGQSFVQLPHAGRWSARLHTQWQPGPLGFDSADRPVLNALAGKILLNGTDPAVHAIASQAVVFNAHPYAEPPGEGTAFDVVTEDRVFTAGDRLHFSVWTRYTTELYAAWNQVPTHLVVRYLGPT